MSLLDEFFIKFTSNAKDVEKDMDSAEKTADKFDKKLNQSGEKTKKTFNDSQKATKEFHEQLEKTDKVTADLGVSFTKLATAGVGALTAFSALGKLKDAIGGTIDYNAALEKQSRLTGISARELDIWRGVVQQAGGDSESFLSFIAQINQQYAELGIGDRVKRVTGDLIGLSKLFEGLSPSQSLSLGTKLGLSPDVVLTLQKGSQALKDMIDKETQLSGVTEENSKAAREFKKEWGLAVDNLTGGFTALGGIVLPILTSILHFFNRPLPIPQWLQNILPDFLLTKYTDQDKRELGISSAGGSASAKGLPLGIRSNNPGNLQPGGREAIFPSMEAGISAEKSQIQRYGAQGVNTLAGIAARYPDRANAQTWLASVSKVSGFGPNDPLNLNDPNTLNRIAAGINVAEGDSAANAILAGQSALAGANSAPIPSSVSNSQKTLSVGSVTINTQANDAAGVASGFHNELSNLYSHTLDGELF